MKPASFLLVVATFALAPAFACSFGVDVTGLFGGTDAASDALSSLEASGIADARTDEDARNAEDAMSDAALVADAGRDAAEGPCMLPNLLLNGDFSLGGEGWGGFNCGVQVLRSAARTGAAGGKVCSPYGYFVAGYGVAPNLPAATYAARVWTRASPGELDTIMRLGVTNDVTGVDVSMGATTAKWKCSETQTSTPVSRLYVQGNGGGGTNCFEVDDAELFLVPDGGTLPPECKCPPP
jgi:hypothetical protein